MSYDVAIVGLGRVGLPLALCFADHGVRVLGIDNDGERLAAVRERRVPFRETGTQELLDRTELALSEHIGDAAQATHIVITLGTPSCSHIEIDMSQIRVALDELRGALHAGQSLILRSTVAPGTSRFVAAYLRRHTPLAVGSEIFVAHAPERIAAGRFVEEIHTLPCISPASGRGAARPSVSCSRSSARQSCRPHRCRPSWPRSGPTSCAPRRLRCRTC